MMVLQKLAQWILKICGWTAIGEVPSMDKVIFIAAPHTSNWDGFWLIVYTIALRVKLRFLAKHSLFWWPLSSLLRGLGAIPIDRRHAASTVNQLVQAFETESHLFLALAPEGTRSWKPYWKSGFYQIAVAAKVPIVLAYIDYAKRQMGIGITIYPCGDAEIDLEKIRDFYKPHVPRHPKLKGPVAFPPR